MKEQIGKIKAATKKFFVSEPDEEERKSIEVHKYYLSQKAGHDVGWETARADWATNFAKKWRLEKKP